jgi:predicted DNA-binding transcriptional regulator AlpA
MKAQANQEAKLSLCEATVGRQAFGQKVVEIQVLTVSAKDAARICGVSRTHWYSLMSSGRLPPPIRLGRRTLWRVADLHRWVAEGCPPLHRWKQIVNSR